MKPAFEVKSARLDALAVQLHTADSAELEAHLQQRIGQYQELSSMPFLLDAQDFSRPEALDIATVASRLPATACKSIGLRHSDEAWTLCRRSPFGLQPRRYKTTAESQLKSVIEPPVPAPVQAQVISQPTVFVNTPIRTGQQVYAENADLIVTGMVSEGAEIIADGNIHVYGPMRGRALAGAAGNRQARISFIRCRPNWCRWPASTAISSKICRRTCIKTGAGVAARRSVRLSAPSTPNKYSEI